VPDRIEIRTLVGKDGEQARLFRNSGFVILGYSSSIVATECLLALKPSMRAHKISRACLRSHRKGRDGEK